jgi:hypothetical protein
VTTLSAKQVPESAAFPASGSVELIEYRPRVLFVRMKSAEGNYVVTFESVVGYRVLDERDLTEFWPQCSTPNGWLFEICSGGWRSLEESRAEFLAPALLGPLKEYLVAGEDECVSVLCEGGKSPSVALVRSNISLQADRER